MVVTTERFEQIWVNMMAAVSGQNNKGLVQLLIWYKQDTVNQVKQDKLMSTLQEENLQWKNTGGSQSALFSIYYSAASKD